MIHPLAKNSRRNEKPLKNISSSLPIESVIPQLRRVLSDGRSAVLQAPPGAGKTTRVPLALLGEPWLKKRSVLMLEPRRLATRAAARRMAAMLGEVVGQTVGYRIRMDARVGPGTRVEVVTEGVLTRRIQNDPSLEGVGIVVFDEFHERSLHADLGLAFCLDVREGLREDLRILIMSATLDAEPAAELLGGAPVITGEGRGFPVETRYRTGPPVRDPVRETAAAVLRALAEETGDVLVFLPGAGEIRRAAGLLERSGPGPGVRVLPLYGHLPGKTQDQAIAPSPSGERKVVLATAIAETSLTIEGIRIVIDSGLMRVPSFDVRAGMARLKTLKASMDSAEQRKGRAGRTAPGICIRLWSREAHGTLVRRNRPEILNTDLTSLALELALWGVSDPAELAWLDRPPPASFSRAADLLVRLGALDARGRITRRGKEMAGGGAHPRLARMIIRGKALGLGGLACELAALLDERDILYFPPGEGDADIRTRVEVIRAVRDQKPLRIMGGSVNHGACRRLLKVIRDLMRRFAIRPGREDPGEAGGLLAFAYPDRIARRRPESRGRFLLSNGRGAYLHETEPLSAEDFLVAANLDGARREARVFLAAPVLREALEERLGDWLEPSEHIAWDHRKKAVSARRRIFLGKLVVRDEPLLNPDPDGMITALLEGIRREGPGALPWSKATRNWRARVMFLRRVEGGRGTWPDVSDEALLDSMETWLAPRLSGVTRLVQLRMVDMKRALEGLLPWDKQKALRNLAPTHVTAPSGSRIAIDYTSGETPVMAVRLQEMFGCERTPEIAGGSAPLLMHLLSPAGRPAQVTSDLAGFWTGAYQDVRKDLRGRYPKHYWPEDPLKAKATRGVKPRRRKK